MTTDINRGLNLTDMGDVTTGEKKAFRDFYDKMLGRGHPGLEFFLNNAPDTMKRYRAFADAGTPKNLAADRRVTGFGFLAYYALTGYVEGVRYLVYIMQQLGLTKSQVIEGLGIAFLHAGPRGSETIAVALKDFPWIEPESPAKFPDGWAADPDAFSTGLDFSAKELSATELKSIERWYEKYLGEVPRYVSFSAEYNPAMLKAYRQRYEHLSRELPKQMVPTSILHYSVSRGSGEGIRENILLARGFGVSRDDTQRIIYSAMVNAGMETLSLVDAVARPIFDRW